MTSIQYVCLIVGLMAGWVLGINGFSEPRGRVPFLNSQRLKNFAWLLGGAGLTSTRDYKVLGADASFSSLQATIAYLEGAFSGVVASILAVSVMLFLSVRHKNRNLEPVARINFWDIIIDYLHYGKEAATTTLSGAEAESIERTQQSMRAEKVRHRDNVVSTLIEGATYAVTGYLQKPKQQRDVDRDLLIETIVKSACRIVELHMTGRVTVRGSYMLHRLLPSGERPPSSCLFIDPDFAGYTAYLETIHGGGLQSGTTVVVPVAGSPSDRDHVLPGAPEAAATQEPVVIVDVRRIKYAPGVPKSLRNEITDYFKKQTYRSLASIAAFDGRILYGVLNIESSAKGLVDDSDGAVQRVLASLAPLVALLSAVER